MFTWSKASLVGTAETNLPGPSSWLSAAFSSLRLSSRLRIAIDGEPTFFVSVRDFEHMLGSRTECPSARAGQLVRRSRTQLCGSLKECQRLIEKIDTTLQHIKQNPIKLNKLLESLQLPRGARDHGWGYILHTLGGCGSAFDLYKVAALTKFRLYLTSVKTALMRATMEVVTLGPENDSPIEPNSKELAAIAKASALTTRVPPQCVA